MSGFPIPCRCRCTPPPLCKQQSLFSSAPFFNCEQRPASSCNILIKKPPKSKGVHSPLFPKQLFTKVLLFTMFNILKYLQVNILSDAENPECLQLVGPEGPQWQYMAMNHLLGLREAGLERGSCTDRQISLDPERFPDTFSLFQTSRNSHCVSPVFMIFPPRDVLK